MLEPFSTIEKRLPLDGDTTAVGNRHHDLWVKLKYERDGRVLQGVRRTLWALSRAGFVVPSEDAPMEPGMDWWTRTHEGEAALKSYRPPRPLKPRFKGRP